MNTLLLDLDGCLLLLLSLAFLYSKEFFSSAVERHNRCACSAVVVRDDLWCLMVVVLAMVEDVRRLVVRVFNLKEFDAVDLLIRMDRRFAPARLSDSLL